MAQFVAIAAAVVGAVSAISEGMAGSAQEKSEAAARDYNAQANTLNAAQRLSEANANEEAQRREARQVLGAQRAAVAESGAGFGGTYAGVLRDSAAAAELDALNIRYRGRLEARGLLHEAVLEKHYGRAASANARASSTGGFLRAGSRALAGYSDYKSAGAAKAGGG